MTSHVLRVAIAAIACIAFPAAAHAGELHAIVAGFNDYSGSFVKLYGAQADADDIAAVLKRRGVHDLVKMTDGSTTVATFRRQFAAMETRSKPGDLILFTFSGHGILVPETREPKKTRDGWEKGFLFPTYSQVTHPDELLHDEDLYDLFKATAAKGIHVLFVVDACHAGTGIRSADPRGRSWVVKMQQFNLTPGITPVVPPKTKAAARPPIPGVAVITAQIAERTVSELPIDGQRRGVLSYAIARGLEGAADPDRTGAITLDMLWQYVRPQVTIRSENTQAPTLFAQESDGGMAILAASSAPPPPTAKLPKPDIVRIFTIGSPNLSTLSGGTFVVDKKSADLIWDPTREQVISAAGDILASDISSNRLQGAVDARRFLSFLRKLADAAGGVDTKLANAVAPLGANLNRNYKAGERVRFEVATGPFTYLTAFDVNSNGDVQFLYPSLESDRLQNSSPLPLSSQDPQVQEPFGGDYVVFIRSDQPLIEFHSEFQKRGMTMPARDAYEAIRRAVRGARYRVGIQGLFTCRTIMGDGRCG